MLMDLTNLSRILHTFMDGADLTDFTDLVALPHGYRGTNTHGSSTPYGRYGPYGLYGPCGAFTDPMGLIGRGHIAFMSQALSLASS